MGTLFCISPEMSRLGVAILVITKKPCDFPDHYCIRAQIAIPGGQIEHDRFAGLDDSLEEARSDLP